MGAINTVLLSNEMDLMKVNTNIGQVITGSRAKDLKLANVPNDGSNALLKGDFIIFPEEAKFDDYYFVLQPEPTEAQKRRGQKPQATAGVMCQVIRGGTFNADGTITGGISLAIPVYAATFKRRVLLYNEHLDENGQPVAKGKFTEDDACIWPGKDLDASLDDKNAAKLFCRERKGLYDAFKQFTGATLEVVERHDPMTLGFSNSEYNEDGSRKRILKEQKVLDIVVKATA